MQSERTVHRAINARSNSSAWFASVAIAAALLIGCGGGGADASGPSCVERACERGACGSDGICVNAEDCAGSDEACLEGFKCASSEEGVGVCRSADDFCDAIACERGVCSFEGGGCAEADPCAIDRECFEGNFCDEGVCRVNQCVQGICARGVCDPATQECVNPSSCEDEGACLPMHLCLEGACVAEADACGVGGCPGTQICAIDREAQSAACRESTDQPCTNALDCVDDRVCAAEACAEPTACAPDALEPAGGSAEPIPLGDVRAVRSFNASACGADVDIYSVEIVGEGELVVDLDYAPVDVGLGTLSIEIEGPGGGGSGPVEAVNGRARASVAIDGPTRFGTYTIVVRDTGDVTTAGVRYSLAPRFVDDAVRAACEIAPTLELGANPGNSATGPTTALTSSCADPVGANAEDIWSLVLTEETFVGLEVVSRERTIDLALSVRSECVDSTSEIRGGCANEERFDGAPERIEALLGPGRYAVIVQSGDGPGLGGPYELFLEQTRAVCTAADDRCLDTATLGRCARDGSAIESIACARGCDAARRACNPLPGDRCRSAPSFDETARLDVEIDFEALSDDYDPGPFGCVRAPRGRIATNGPDAVWEAIVPPGYAVRAALESQDDTALYAMVDCGDVARCESGANVTARGFEDLFWNNESDQTRRVSIVADVARSEDGTYAPARLIAEVIEAICAPDASSCTTDEMGRPAAHICASAGQGFLNEKVTCTYGCDQGGSGGCLRPENDSCGGAIVLTPGVAETELIDEFTARDINAQFSCPDLVRSRGPNAIYAVSAGPEETVELELTADGFDAALWVSRSCDLTAQELGACVAGVNDLFTSPDVERLAFFAPVAATYYVSVRASREEAEGSFSLTASVSPAACTPNQAPACRGGAVDSCDEAGKIETFACGASGCAGGFCEGGDGEVCASSKELVGTSGTLVDESFGVNNDLVIGPGRQGACLLSSNEETDGPDRFYRVAVQPGDVLDVTLETEESNAYVAIQEGCAPGVCRALNTFRSPTRQTYLYEGIAPTELSVIVDRTRFVNSPFDDRYTLHWEVRSGLTCAPKSTRCLGPKSVGVCDDSGTDETTYTCEAGCVDGACLADLAVNETCALASAAAAIGSGIYVISDHVILNNDLDLGPMNCVGEATGGGDLFYKVEVPPGEVLRARVEGPRFGSSALYLIEDCAMPEASCLAGDAADQDGLARLYWANTTSATKTVIVGVDTPSSLTSSRPFALLIDVRTPECVSGAQVCAADNETLRRCGEAGFYENFACGGASGACAMGRCTTPEGDVCFDAIELSGPSGTTGQVAFEGTNSLELEAGLLDGACAISRYGPSQGVDRFYTIELEGGELLDLDLTTANDDAHLLLFEGSCAGARCVRNHIRQGAGSISYYHAGPLPQLFTVVVDTASNLNPAPFTLDWSVSTGRSCAPGEERCLADGSTLALCNEAGSAEVTTACPGGVCSGTACVIAPTATESCGVSVPDIGQGIVMAADLRGAVSEVTLSTSSCVGAEVSGPDFFVRALVPAGRVVRARAEAASTRANPVVYLFESCALPEASCVAGGSSRAVPGVAEASWRNPDMSGARTIFIGVAAERVFSADVVRLEVELLDPECAISGSRVCDTDATTSLICAPSGLYEPYACDGACGGPGIAPGACANPSGELCADAVTLDRAGGALLDQSFGETNDFELPASSQSGACLIGGASQGQEVFYRIDLLAGELFEASVEATTNTYVHLFEGCGGREACLDGNPNRSRSVRVSHYAAQDMTIALAVDTNSASALDQERFDLRWSVRSGLLCAPEKTRCLSATSVGICSSDGLNEIVSPCPTACSNGFCDFAPATANLCDVALIENVGSGTSIAGRFADFINTVTLPPLTSCAGSRDSPGPDAFFAIDLAPGEIARARLDAADSFEGPLLYLFEDCAMPQASCLAGAASRGGGLSGRAEVVWRNDDPSGTPARTVIVGVDSEGRLASDPFGLTIERLSSECFVPNEAVCGGDGQSLRVCNEVGLYEIYACDGACVAGRCLNPTGEICADAIALLGASGRLADQTFGSSDDAGPSPGRIGACFVSVDQENRGPERFYRVDLAANDALTVELETDHIGAYVAISGSCDESSCLANTPLGGTGPVRYFAEQAESVFIVVDTRRTSPGTDTYALNWSIESNRSCAPDAFRCFTDNITLEKCSSNGMSAASLTSCAHGCSAGACERPAIAANACSSASSGLDVGAGYAVYFTPGDPMQTWTNDVDLVALSCAQGAGTGGPDLFYKVSVAPDQILRARAESYAGEDPIVYAFTSCTDIPGTCLAGGRPIQAGEGSATLRWLNDTALPVEVIVAIDSELASPSGPFGLFIETIAAQCPVADTTTCAPDGVTLQACDTYRLLETYQCNASCDAVTGACSAPSGDACFEAIQVNPGGTAAVPQTYTYAAVSGAGATSQYSHAGECPSAFSFPSPGPDQFYAVRLADMQTVEATMTPGASSTGGIFVAIVSGCTASATCHVGQGSMSGARSVLYTNRSGAPETVYVIADRRSTIASGTYDLDIEVR